MVKNQFKENEMSETIKWVRYTLEFKLAAVRQTGVGAEYRQDNDIG
jgi:hypothetical protein